MAKSRMFKAAESTTFEELEDQIEAVLTHESTDFFQIADMFGLNPKQDFVGADLSGINVSGKDLSHANLSGANLSGANLSGANLSGANLSGANLSGAELGNIVAKNAVFTGSQGLDPQTVDYLKSLGGIFDLKSQVISCSSEMELSEGSKYILKKEYASLFAFYEKSLSSFNLSGKYSAADIFSDSYERAIRSFRNKKDGYSIKNLYAWYRIAGYNIIREAYRREKREKETEESLKKEIEESLNFPSKESSPEESLQAIKYINGFLKNEMDSKVVFLRSVIKLSWEDLCAKLIEEGDLNCELSKQCIDRIRQRYSRAIKKLRSLINQ